MMGVCYGPVTKCDSRNAYLMTVTVTSYLQLFYLTLPNIVTLTMCDYIQHSSGLLIRYKDFVCCNGGSNQVGLL